MDLKFYNNLKLQPDLQDVIVYLKAPLNKLELIEQKFKNSTEKAPLNKTDLLDKITKLNDKYLVKLMDNYCKLDLEYRNTVVIKEHKSNNEIIKYTSKDILLQNLSKLIEEIEILSHELNIDNNDISVETPNNLAYEIEQETNTPLTIEKEVFTKEEVQTQSPENKFNLSDKINYFFSGSSGELKFFLLFMIISTLMVYTLFNKVQLTNYTNMTEKMITDMMVGAQKEFPQKNYKGLSADLLYMKGHMDNRYVGIAYHNGKYITPFGGLVTINPATNKTADDSFIIKADLVPEQVCTKLANNLQAKHPKLMKINEKIVVKDGFIDPYKVKQACSFDHNNFTIIN